MQATSTKTLAALSLILSAPAMASQLALEDSRNNAQPSLEALTQRLEIKALELSVPENNTRGGQPSVSLAIAAAPEITTHFLEYVINQQGTYAKLRRFNEDGEAVETIEEPLPLQTRATGNFVVDQAQHYSYPIMESFVRYTSPEGKEYPAKIVKTDHKGDKTKAVAHKLLQSKYTSSEAQDFRQEVHGDKIREFRKQYEKYENHAGSPYLWYCGEEYKEIDRPRPAPVAPVVTPAPYVQTYVAPPRGPSNEFGRLGQFFGF